MFARRIKANSKGNVYLQVILATLKDPAANHDEKGLLSALLAKYIEGCKTTLSYRYNKECAETCQTILTDPKKTIADAINYLNTIQNFNQNGDFIQLLNTFFSVYPKLVGSCSDTIKKILLTENLWQKPVESWFKDYIAEYHNQAISRDYELLPQLSEYIPASQADKYADLLLYQLTHTHHGIPGLPGLHKGWMYSALGTLFKTNRLSSAKQQTVTTALLKHFKYFDSAEFDLSLIGLCEALCATAQDQLQTRDIATRFHAYVSEMLPKSRGLFADNAGSDAANYIQKTFSVLHVFSEHYSEITRSGITQFMLRPDNIYPLRRGILTLESWISDTAKEELLYTIERNQHFHELAPLFWHWVKYDTNHHDNDWTRKNRFEAHLNDARRGLQNPALATPIIAHIQLLNADNSTRLNVKAYIITKLVDAFANQNKINDPNDNFRTALIQSFKLMIPWYSERIAPNIARILSSASRHNEYPDEVRTQMACVTASMAGHLDSSDQAALRHYLLQKLGNGGNEVIISALTEYTNTTHHQDTPEIMTHLLVSDDIRAKLLLAQLHDAYRQSIELEAAPHPASGFN